MNKRPRKIPIAGMYSIKTVCAETGLLPVTLRAWEARYQLVTPSRSKNNYRVYSARELALLRWVKQRVDAGNPIRLVAVEANRLRRAGRRMNAPSVQPLQGGNPSLSADCLFDALTTHRETEADRCLKEARMRFDLPVLCLEVIAPCLWRIGDAWEGGAIRIATEHFASNYLRGQLLGWYQSAPSPRQGPLILVGCGPMEFHDIGSLILALLLRRRRYRVEFLGQDLSLDDLRAYIRDVRPALVCLSANAEGAARQLVAFESSLKNIKSSPVFGFGGRAFSQNPRLQRGVPGVFLGETVPAAIDKIQNLLKSNS
jgi:DNA-binding transcriptional MerR regulator